MHVCPSLSAASRLGYIIEPCRWLVNVIILQDRPSPSALGLVPQGVISQFTEMCSGLYGNLARMTDTTIPRLRLPSM